MARTSAGFALVVGVLLSAAAVSFGQTPTPAAPERGAQAPAPSGAGRGGGQGVGSQGDPDPGVHYVVIVDNPSVRVLQVTLQPGAVRRPHVHNDVTFHMLIPVTGAVELTADGLGTINAVAGQAYYMLKGQPHGFTNKGAAAAQIVEIFVKGPAPEPFDPNAPPTPPPVAPATKPVDRATGAGK